MTGELQLALLGQADVRLDGEPVVGFYSSKAQALLFYLVVTGTSHSRPALAGLLWADMPEADARTNLRQALTNLRRLVGRHLTITRQTVTFDRDNPYWLDVEAFRAGVAGASDGSGSSVDETGMERLRDAVDLYQGDFLAGFHVRDAPLFEEWMLAQQAELRRSALGGLHKLAAYYAGQGDYESGIACTRRLLDMEPWHEGAHRQLMLLLARDGQRSAALAQYKACREVLLEELGVEPAAETTALYNRIWVARSELRHNLPPQPTPLVGREDELAQLAHNLADPDCRLLTIVGPGGMGKTRLALQAAEKTVDFFLNGVTFVPLASVSSKQDVVPAVAEALGLRLQPGRPEGEQLTAFLLEKELLLVLDNFEQLLPGTELLVDLMRQAPDLVLLATSRQRLNLQAEWVFDLAGLDYPAGSAPEDLESYSAVQLFIQRARQVERDFSLSAADAPPVAHICRLCGGMPLAIELAAATVRYQSCAQIAGQLQRNWQALTATYGDLPERHQSIHAAFEHSWALLSTQEQGVFSGLSVFQGGFDDEAAAQVARSSREALHALIDKSLVQRGGAGRFGMHPLIHQYASEKLRQLGGYEETRGRHLDYYLALAEKGEQKLKGQGQLRWSKRLEMEQQNMLAAIAWGMEANLEGAARLAAANWLFWFARGHLRQGRQQYEALLARKARLPASLRARVLTGCAAMAWLQGDLERTTAVTEEGLHLFKELGDTEGIALSLHHLGIVYRNQSKPDRAQALYEEALDLAQTLADGWLASVVLIDLGVDYQEQGRYERAKSAYNEALKLDRERDDRWAGLYAQVNLADSAYEQGDFAEAKVRFEEALPLAKEFGDKQVISGIYNNRGRIALDKGDLAQATYLFEQALVTNQELGSASGIAETHSNLGDVAASRGYFDQAAAAYQEAVRFYRQATYQAGIITCLERLAELAWLRVQAPQAVRWLAAAEAQRTRLKLPRPPVEQQRYERRLKAMRTQLDEDTFSRLWANGTAASLDDALDDTQGCETLR